MPSLLIKLLVSNSLNGLLLLEERSAKFNAIFAAILYESHRIDDNLSSKSNNNSNQTMPLASSNNYNYASFFEAAPVSKVVGQQQRQQKQQQQQQQQQPLRRRRRRQDWPGLLEIQLVSLTVLLTLTGFVCTNKAHPGEECLSNSNVICFECDSRHDPNCADPFDFSPSATLDTSSMMSMLATMKTKSAATNESAGAQQLDHDQQATDRSAQVVGANSTLRRQPKQLPKSQVCHGCCVKITSRMPDGGVFVKRTCTSNLQINYFMVGLVCMKESGDRGKMCFCETDYCNGQTSTYQIAKSQLIIVSLLSIALTSLALMPSSQSIQKSER